MVGGSCNPNGSTRRIILNVVGGADRVVKGVEYRLRPRHYHPLHTRVVRKGLSIKR